MARNSGASYVTSLVAAMPSRMTNMLPSTTASPLTPNFLTMGMDLLGDSVLGRTAGYAVDVPHHSSDECDPHHPSLEFGGGGMPLGHAEGIDDQETDLPVADGASGMARQLAPHICHRLDCKMNVPPWTKPLSGLTCMKAR